MTVRTRLLEVAEDVRDSYWFLPGLLAFSGFVSGLVLVFLDTRIGEQWLGAYEWFYGTRPNGARQILATIAGSTITVAGVVFSITLAAVTYASGQYGPRLLSNFIRDRGNQVTLGVFVGTFLYCLVVLRTVRSAQEASAATVGGAREAFVPHLAMFGALILAVASISVLIYFVHHVTFGIHINNVIAKIGRKLIADIRSVGPSGEGEADQGAIPVRAETVPIHATATGYIEAINHDALVAIASSQDIMMFLARSPGDFVHEGRPLMDAQPLTRIDPAVQRSCNAAFVIGGKRTPLQDLRFGIDELVEIAARALSPGVNDPFTAFACIDWLGAALSEIGRVTPSAPVHTGTDGRARVVLRQWRFEDYLFSAFGQLRPYVAIDMNARRRTLATLDEVAAGLREEHYRELVLEERRALASHAPD